MARQNREAERRYADHLDLLSHAPAAEMPIRKHRRSKLQNRWPNRHRILRIVERRVRHAALVEGYSY